MSDDNTQIKPWKPNSGIKEVFPNDVLLSKLWGIANAVLSAQGSNAGGVTALESEEWNAIEEMAVNIELNLRDIGYMDDKLNGVEK